MTFQKLTEKDIDYLLGCVIGARGVDWEKTDIEKKLEIIKAWMGTIPEQFRYVYFLGRES